MLIGSADLQNNTTAGVIRLLTYQDGEDGKNKEQSAECNGDPE